MQPVYKFLVFTDLFILCFYIVLSFLLFVSVSSIPGGSEVKKVMAASEEEEVKKRRRRSEEEVKK